MLSHWHRSNTQPWWKSGFWAPWHLIKSTGWKLGDDGFHRIMESTPANAPAPWVGGVILSPDERVWGEVFEKKKKVYTVSLKMFGFTGKTNLWACDYPPALNTCTNGYKSHLRAKCVCQDQFRPHWLSMWIFSPNELSMVRFLGAPPVQWIMKSLNLTSCISMREIFQ